jgi:catechol 2,3-dioxygenase
MSNDDIVRAAHVEFIVKDLERSRKFYVDTLGFIETSSNENRIYLRGIEDRFHHSLILTKGSFPAVSHIAFRVSSEEGLDRLAQLFEEEMQLNVKWIDEEEEEGLGRAFRIQDPFGYPLEFFKSMEEKEWLLRRFEEHRFARVLRFDHANVLCPDVDSASHWYTRKLGFLCSELTETEDGKIWATWLRRKPSVHDIAIMTGEGPRLHHAGFYVAEKDSILDCADVLASKGYVASMERGPGRHGISNAFFLYLRDPDGHRVELYTGDYLAADPDWKPVKWKLDDPQRQTFWGAPAPESWFNEASILLSVYDGKPVLTTKPLYDPRKKGTKTLAH